MPHRTSAILTGFYLSVSSHFIHPFCEALAQALVLTHKHKCICSNSLIVTAAFPIAFLLQKPLVDCKPGAETYLASPPLPVIKTTSHPT